MDNKKTKEYKDKTDEELRQLIGRATEIFIKLTEPKSKQIKEEGDRGILPLKQKSTSQKTFV